MARLRLTEPPATVERPAWLHRFLWQDWDEPGPVPDEVARFATGVHADPAEVAWCRRALAARDRWNAARSAWFSEHGEGANYYRVRLTGKTPQDIEDEGEAISCAP